MIPSSTTRQGYFNALTSSSFKIGTDGRRLFFPWGVLGSGYVIPSEGAYERLRTQLTIYLVTAMALIIGATVFHSVLTSAAVGGLMTAFYAAWIGTVRRGWTLSAESMTVQDGIAAQARTHTAATLWALEITSLVLVAGSLLMLVMGQTHWLMAVFSMGLFSGCAAVYARMLLLRRDVQS